MFSGKSKKLVQVYKSIKDDKIIFKPVLDTRNRYLVQSRDGEKALAIPVTNIETVLDMVTKNHLHIFFDEIFLFSGNIFTTITSLLERGYIVHIAGLNYDYRGEEFPVVTKLIHITPEYNRHSLHGWCHICNKPSDWTVRFTNGKLDDVNSPLIVIDDGNHNVVYQTRCKEHQKYPYLK